MKGESTPRLGLFRRVWPAAALVFPALDTSALAGLDTGAAAYNKGDYATALHELSPLAENGDAEAQFLLESMFEGGLGVEQSYVEAIKWYGRAAGRGYAPAQNNLAYLYLRGWGVANEPIQAYLWSSLAE